MRLVLASASPRRAELLRAAGVDFETLAVDIDEAARAGEDPAEYVRRLAAEKSARALEAYVVSGFSRTVDDHDLVVLGADTTVVIDGEILGKPRDASECESMLRRLSGRRHEVLTGVSLRRTLTSIERVERTTVEFVTLSDADVAWYVSRGEGLDKAGAYAIQGLASRFVSRIEGSYSNVVGLPVHTVLALLRIVR